jgi:hypothetical protein
MAEVQPAIRLMTSNRPTNNCGAFTFRKRDSIFFTTRSSPKGLFPSFDCLDPEGVEKLSPFRLRKTKSPQKKYFWGKNNYGEVIGSDFPCFFN